MIVVELTEQQRQNLLTLLDVAVRASGLVNAGPAAEIARLLAEQKDSKPMQGA